MFSKDSGVFLVSGLPSLVFTATAFMKRSKSTSSPVTCRVLLHQFGIIASFNYIIFMLTSEVIAYTAGIFDGEGCVTTSGVGFRVTVSNTDKVLLDWLKSNWGGCVNDMYLPSNPKHNVAWKWIQAKESGIYSFLSTIRPYLLLKATQADAVLKYLKSYPGRKNPWDSPNHQRRIAFQKTKELLRVLKLDRHFKRT
jgi:hypothetical protein